MKKGLRYTLAIIVGLFLVFVVQMAITKLWNLAGIYWGPNSLPFETIQQIGMLSSAFIAGVVGPAISVIIARKKALAIVLIFLLVGLSIDVYASLVPLKPVATWFRIAWVLSVPIQVYFGIILGARVINKP